MSDASRSATHHPRHPRHVVAGPRVRRIELLLFFDAALAILAAFAAALLFLRHRPLPGSVLAALALVLVLLDARRVLYVNRLRRIAREGAITQATIVDRRRRRFTAARRADGKLRILGRPVRARLEITYEFVDDAGTPVSGRFVVAPRESRFYRRGAEIEVFFRPDAPRRNVASLVLRWYFQLGGAALTDEAPPLDEHEFDVAWEDDPDRADGSGEGPTPP